MRVQAFEKLIRSGPALLRTLRQRRYKKSRLFCYGCDSRRIYRLASGRYRCGRCRYTFGLFTGTWLGQARVPLPTWVWLIKLFELEVTARQAAIQTGVSYPTALGIFTIIRRALLAQEQPELLRWEVEADESYFGGRRKGRRGRAAAGKVPVFGILERRGRVAVTVVTDVSAKTLLQETVKVVKRGSLVYTDKFGGYDALTFCGYRHLTVNHSARFSRGRVHINAWKDSGVMPRGNCSSITGFPPSGFRSICTKCSSGIPIGSRISLRSSLMPSFTRCQIFDNHLF